MYITIILVKLQVCMKQATCYAPNSSGSHVHRLKMHQGHIMYTVHTIRQVNSDRDHKTK